MNQSKVAHSQGEGKPESERNKGGEGVKKEKKEGRDDGEIEEKERNGGWELTSSIK